MNWWIYTWIYFCFGACIQTHKRTSALVFSGVLCMLRQCSRSNISFYFCAFILIIYINSVHLFILIGVICLIWWCWTQENKACNTCSSALSIFTKHIHTHTRARTWTCTCAHYFNKKQWWWPPNNHQSVIQKNFAVGMKLIPDHIRPSSHSRSSNGKWRTLNKSPRNVNELFPLSKPACI